MPSMVGGKHHVLGRERTIDLLELAFGFTFNHDYGGGMIKDRVSWAFQQFPERIGHAIMAILHERDLDGFAVCKNHWTLRSVMIASIASICRLHR